MFGSTFVDVPIPLDFLDQLVKDVPSTWLPSDVRAELKRLRTLPATESLDAAGILAERLASEAWLVPFGEWATREFFSARIGCQAFPPTSFGVDLVSLCLRDGTP